MGRRVSVLIFTVLFIFCPVAGADYIIEDFESYQNDAELLAVWGPDDMGIYYFQNFLETDPNNACSGSQSMRVEWDWNYAPYFYPGPHVDCIDQWGSLDLSEYDKFEISFKGSAGSIGTAYVQLYSFGLYPQYGYTLETISFDTGTTNPEWTTGSISIGEYGIIGEIDWSQFGGVAIFIDPNDEFPTSAGTCWVDLIVATLDPDYPHTPIPTEYQTDVDIYITELSWTPGNLADLGLGEDVWFSTDSALVESCDPSVEYHVSTNSLPIASTAIGSPLEYNTTYYWRVRDYNGLDEYLGMVWQFKNQVKITNAYPVDDQDEVALDVTLSWTKAAEATDQMLYISENESDVISRVGGVDIDLAESYGPLDLDYNTTYHWAVDEIIGAVTAYGDVRSFATLEAEIVDGFETYADTTALRAVWSYHERSPISLIVDPGVAYKGDQCAKFIHLAYMSATGYVEGLFSSATQDQRSAISFYWAGLDTNTSPSLMTVELLDDEGATLGNLVAVNTDPNAVIDPCSTVTDPNYVRFIGTTADFGLVNFADMAAMRINIETTLASPVNERCTIYLDNVGLAPAVCELALQGDLDGDCDVDFYDYVMMANDWPGPLDPDYFLPVKDIADDWLECNLLPQSLCFE